MQFREKNPKGNPTAFIAQNALVIGDVEIGPEANIWFHCIVRRDVNYVRIGSHCNIQDACVLHVEKDLHPLILEDDVALGHRVVAHGCRIKSCIKEIFYLKSLKLRVKSTTSVLTH